MIDMVWIIPPHLLSLYCLDDNFRFGWHDLVEEEEERDRAIPAFLMGATQVKVTLDLPRRVAVMIDLMEGSVQPTSKIHYDYNMNLARKLMQKCRDRGRPDLAEKLIYSYEHVGFLHTTLYNDRKSSFSCSDKD